MFVPTYTQFGVPSTSVPYIKWRDETVLNKRIYPLDNPLATFLSLLFRAINVKHVAVCLPKFSTRLPDFDITIGPKEGSYDAVIVHTVGQITSCVATWGIHIQDQESLFAHPTPLISPDIQRRVYELPGTNLSILVYTGAHDAVFPSHPIETPCPANARLSLRSTLAKEGFAAKGFSATQELNIDVHPSTIAHALSDWHEWVKACGKGFESGLSMLALGRALVNFATFTLRPLEDIRDICRSAPPWMLATERAKLLSTEYIRPSTLNLHHQHGPTTVKISEDSVELVHSLPKTGRDPSLREVFTGLIMPPYNTAPLLAFLRTCTDITAVWSEYDTNVPDVPVFSLNPLGRRFLASEAPRGHIVVAYVSNESLWKEVTEYARSLYRCHFTLLNLSST